MMASLVTTKAIVEGIDADKPMSIASLDTQKAFDVVWQHSLAIRVFINTPIEYWHTHVSLLTDTQLEVRIVRQFSN